MSSALYTPEILRLALDAAAHPRLERPHITREGRAVPCGSTMALDLAFDDNGRVEAFGMVVNACAFGQASAGLMARGIAGKNADDLVAHYATMQEWLTTTTAAAPDWPGMDALAPARGATARHGAMLLPFRIAAEIASEVDLPSVTGLNSSQ